MQSLFNLNQPGFSRFVSLSLIAHGVILFFALFIMKEEPKKLFYTPVYTPVELVAAPAAKPKPKPVVKKTKPKPTKKTPVKKTPAKKAKPKPKSKAVALKKSKPAPPAPDTSVEDMLSKLQAKVQKEEEADILKEQQEELKRTTEYEERRNKRELEELKREIKELEEEHTLVSANAKTPRPASGGDAVSSELFELEFKAYYSKIGSKIQSLWIYVGEVREGLETLITIKIDRSGALIDYWIEKRSGDSFFDESAIKAVSKAAPFPVLPTDFNEDTLEIGLRFCPGGCKSARR